MYMWEILSGCLLLSLFWVTLLQTWERARADELNLLSYVEIFFKFFFNRRATLCKFLSDAVMFKQRLNLKNKRKE